MIPGIFPGPSLQADPAGYALTVAQIVLIDLALAGDNAIAIGLAAAGLPEARQQRRVIAWGMAVAVVLRIGLALVAVRLLKVVGLALAGGVILLWVGWRLFTDTAAHRQAGLLQAEALRAARQDPEAAAALATAASHRRSAPRSFAAALALVLFADLSMSLDNVLAVAGAGRERPLAMAAGLLLSAVIVGLGAGLAANMVGRWRWLGYIAVAVVLATAARMIWDGGLDVLRSGALDGLCACRRPLA